MGFWAADKKMDVVVSSEDRTFASSSITSEAEGASKVPTGVRISAGKGVGRLSRRYFIVARQSGS